MLKRTWILISILLLGLAIYSLTCQNTSEPDITDPTTSLGTNTHSSNPNNNSTSTGTMEPKPPEYTSGTEITVYHYPPIVTITSPDYGSTQAATFSFTGWIETNNTLQEVAYRIDTQPFIPIETTTTFSYELSAMTEGSHLLEVKATTVSGLTGSHSIMFNVDPQSPIINVTEPVNERRISGQTSIYGTATDFNGIGLQRIQLSIDSADPVTADGLENWSYTWDSTGYSLGNHTLLLWAEDKVGNTSNMVTITVAIESNADVGGILNTDENENAKHPAIAYYNGTPFVAFSERVGGVYQVKVKSWDGSSWQQVGDALNMDPTMNATEPTIGIKVDKPVVAFVEVNNSIQKIYAKEWDGSDWVSLGGALNNSASVHAYAPELLAFTSTMIQPIVVWQEKSGGSYEIFCRQWNGVNAWDMKGTDLGCPSYAECYTPSVTYLNSEIYVAFHQRNTPTNNAIRVRRLAGASWTDVGPFLNVDPTEQAYEPCITHNDINAYVSWAEQASGIRQIYVRYWNGTAWTAVGDTLNVDYQKQTYFPKMIFNDGVPYVGFLEKTGTLHHLYVKRYMSGAWELIGGRYWNVDYDRNIFGFDLTFGDKPYVAFYEQYEQEKEKVRVKSTTE